MTFKISHKTLSIGYFAVCMVSLILFMCVDMQGQEHNTTGVAGAGMLTCLTIVILAGASLKFLITKGYKAYKPDITIFLYSIFILWTIIPVIIYDRSATTITFITTIIKHIIPLFSLLIPYNFLLNHRDSKIFGWFFCLSSLMFAICYFKVMLELLATNPLEPPHMIISYYTLYILPLILVTCGNKRRIFFILFTAIVLTTSIKRGGILSLGLGLIAFAFTYAFTSKKIKLSTVFTALVSLALIVSVFMFIADSDDNNLLERFANIEDDNGSGRTIVWSVVIDLILNSDFIPLLFGHGYNAVSLDANVGMSAHNDFLEVIYDYGIIGVVLYTSAVLSFLHMTITHVLRRTQYACALTMLSVIYLTLSMMSHVVIYTWFNLILLTISYISARDKLDARNE